ncbi:transposase [Aromatoleum evansii]|uniref:transposase n=1 Tax=Aromatoleum evansii TaxID=59406 RepID=UPI00388FFEC6
MRALLHPDLITHPLRDLVAQRSYGLRSGYEDLNDHTALRSDPQTQTAVGTSTNGQQSYCHAR